MADYQIGLLDPYGTPLAILDSFQHLDYVRIVNDIGSLVLIMPDVYDKLLFVGTDVRADNRIEVNRRIGSGLQYRDTDTQWLVTKGEKIFNSRGERLTKITCEDLNTLLRRRIIAYNSGSTQASKTDQADDMMKAIVRENLGSLATDTDRSWATYLSVEADLGLGQSISKSFSRRRVIDVLKELANASYQAGTYIAFDIVATSQTTLLFRTFAGQRGIDRRHPAGINPLIIGPDFGNLADVVRGYDHSAEITYAYAGGQGEGASRVIGVASDTTRIGASPFGRREGFADARTTSDATQVQDEARSLVKGGVPRNTFTGVIVDTPSTIYGLHYGFGDIVTAVFEGESIDCYIDKIRVTVTPDKEQIDSQFRALI
jgi:hypothetical protein